MPLSPDARMNVLERAGYAHQIGPSHNIGIRSANWEAIISKSWWFPSSCSIQVEMDDRLNTKHLKTDDVQCNQITNFKSLTTCVVSLTSNHYNLIGNHNFFVYTADVTGVCFNILQHTKKLNQQGQGKNSPSYNIQRIRLGDSNKQIDDCEYVGA